MHLLSSTAVLQSSSHGQAWSSSNNAMHACTCKNPGFPTMPTNCFPSVRAQRSASMVQELEQFNEQLRRIAAKKKEGQQAAAGDGNSSNGSNTDPRAVGLQQQQQQQQGEAAQHSSAASTTSPAVTSPAQGAPDTSTVPGAEAAPEAVAVHASKAQPPAQEAAGSSVSSSEVESFKPANNSAVSRALSLLDTLLPEEQQQGNKK
eukprot:scaffold202860_cov19-Tisochrysis_lutea.AAC.3